MSTTTITTAVASARAMLWLAEVCRDIGVDPAAINWETFSRPAHTVQVRDVDDLARLGDRLGLGPVEYDGGIASRQAEWADFEVRAFCGVEA